MRFVSPQALRDFLNFSDQLLVYGRHLQIRLFEADKNPLQIRQRTLLPKNLTEDKLLSLRNMYFDDHSGAAAVLVDNVPNIDSSKIISWAKNDRDSSFDWGYAWKLNKGTARMGKNAARVNDW
jgi:hypothetical protein